jgi:DNA-binding MarR family transcriptional regulator
MSEVTSARGDVSAPHVLAGRLRLSMVRLSRQLRRMDPSELTIAQFSALATVVRTGPLGVGRGVQLEATPKGAELLERRAQIGNAWLAGHLSALGKADKLAVERAVTVLESFATERSGETPTVAGEYHDSEETPR